jgi:hypothetical protein
MIRRALLRGLFFLLLFALSPPSYGFGPILVPCLARSVVSLLPFFLFPLLTPPLAAIKREKEGPNARGGAFGLRFCALRFAFCRACYGSLPLPLSGGWVL